MCSADELHYWSNEFCDATESHHSADIEGSESKIGYFIMSSEDPLDNWRFLIGTWKGSSKEMYDEESEIISFETFTEELSGRFIMGQSEATKEGEPVNTSISLMYYDVRDKRFLRHTAFSYGFVNHETAYKSTNSELRFEIEMVPVPKAFIGTRWRSFIVKMSDTEVKMGLESAKDNGAFETYGETVYTKVSA